MNETICINLTNVLSETYNIITNDTFCEIIKNKSNKNQFNKIIEKEREIQQLIYSIKPKNYVT